MLKKFFAKLISLEYPFSSGKTGDPRTDLKTRGAAKPETAEQKFKREQEEALFNLQEQQKAAREKGVGEQSVDITEELEKLEK